MTILRVSLAKHLAGLDVAGLAAVLEWRPDVLLEPPPRDVDGLAERLGGVESLSAALGAMDADEYATAVAVAVGARDLAALADRLSAAPAEVAAVVDRLTGRALAWRDGEVIGLPKRLADHLVAALHPFRPVAQIAKEAQVHELQAAVHRLGGNPSGTKSVLATRLGALLADRGVVQGALAQLSPDARRSLATLFAVGGHTFTYGPPDAGDRELVRAGLALGGGPYHRPGLPREVATILLPATTAGLTGRPAVPASSDPVDDGRAAAETAVRALTALLDEAASAPLAALRKGGIGTRERKRLAGRLGVTEPALLIDLAAELGLLVPVTGGYASAADYPVWREEPVAARWAALARAWFGLDLTPTDRTTDDGEVAPPVPLVSAGGLIRRALLRAAAGGGSLAAAAAAIDWFCPVHGYDATGRDRKLAVARNEAQLIGVVAGDRLTTLGERLVIAADPDVADLLPETHTLLVLQSDLSAVVSGQPSAAAARVLAAAATPEGHGVAATWRFSPASVRAALDAGWTAESLRAELAAASDRELPQPLEYLLRDVARRHGGVRVRGTRCCLTGDEAEMTEILHTRGLARLDLRRLAPTVLTSPAEPAAVLAALRKAGFAPMPEDADGTVVLPPPETAAASRRTAPRRPAVTAADLAARLAVGR